VSKLRPLGLPVQEDAGPLALLAEEVVLAWKLPRNYNFFINEIWPL